METEPGSDKLKEATVPGRGKKRPPSPALFRATTRRTRRCPPATTTVGTSVRRSRRKKKKNDDEDYRVLDVGMSPADRAMANQMRLYNEISRTKLAVMQSIWHERKETEEDARKAPLRKVKKVHQLAAECGASGEAPELFRGVMKIVKVESVMDLFIRTTPAGRLIIIKQYAEADVQSVAESRRRHCTDDGFFEFILDFMDDEDDAFMYCMYEYAMHIDKEEQEEEEKNDDEDYRDTATSRAKKSKTKDDQAVRAMVNKMRVLNEISKNKLAVVQSKWHKRKETEEDARKALERKVEKVDQLAAECGVTPEEAPGLFMGVVKIVQVESVMDMFIRTTPAERLIIIKQYAGVDN